MSSLRQVPTPPALTLRVATPDDDRRILRLAALDSAPPPRPPALLAELDGEVCVAVSLVDLATVADPFRHTAAIQALAVARARQLRDQDRRPAARPSRRPSRARAPRPQTAA